MHSCSVASSGSACSRCVRLGYLNFFKLLRFEFYTKANATTITTTTTTSTTNTINNMNWCMTKQFNCNFHTTTTTTTINQSINNLATTTAITAQQWQLKPLYNIIYNYCPTLTTHLLICILLSQIECTTVLRLKRFRSRRFWGGGIDMIGMIDLGSVSCFAMKNRGIEIIVKCLVVPCTLLMMWLYFELLSILMTIFAPWLVTQSPKFLWYGWKLHGRKSHAV